MCVPSTHPNACGKPCRDSNLTTSYLISSTVLGSLIYFGPRYEVIAWQIILETVLFATPNAFAVILIEPVSFKK